MLTPVEIQNKTFKSGGLGYDKKDVEAFMRDVGRNYEEIYRQNMEYKDKIAVLTEGIQYYKSIEKTLQRALVLAEKTADETRATAQKEAKRIEKEANVKAKLIIADAKNELNSLHSQTVQLIEQYEKYKLQFKNLAKTQIELIESDAFSINVQNLDAFISEKDIMLDSDAAAEDTSDTSNIPNSDSQDDSEVIETDFRESDFEDQDNLENV